MILIYNAFAVESCECDFKTVMLVDITENIVINVVTFMTVSVLRFGQLELHPVHVCTLQNCQTLEKTISKVYERKVTFRGYQITHGKSMFLRLRSAKLVISRRLSMRNVHISRSVVTQSHRWFTQRRKFLFLSMFSRK